MPEVVETVVCTGHLRCTTPQPRNKAADGKNIVLRTVWSLKNDKTICSSKNGVQADANWIIDGVYVSLFSLVKQKFIMLLSMHVDVLAENALKMLKNVKPHSIGSYFSISVAPQSFPPGRYAAL